MRNKFGKTIALLTTLACVCGFGAMASCAVTPGDGGSDSLSEVELADGEYAVKAVNATGGNILPEKEKAKQYDTVSATIKADKGYRLKRIYANGVELKFSESETEDFTYTVRALMPAQELVFTAEYAENPVIDETYGYALSANGTTTSHWKVSYGEEGMLFNVLVEDANVILNGRVAVEERDFVEFRVCYATDAQGLENANALRCLVTADGTFLLQKCLGANDYLASGYQVGYTYGDNFTTETLLCTKSKNDFDGYAVEVFLGYELFGLSKDEALGNMTFAPAVSNTTSTNGAKIAYGVSWRSAETEMTADNAEKFFADKYKCQYGNPATYFSVAANGKLGSRYASSYTGAEYLFLGDSTFADERWTVFAESFASEKVYNIAFKNITAKALASATAVDGVQTLAPKNIVLSAGEADLNAGASAYTTAARIVKALQAYRAALPETEFYWTALLPSAYSITGATAYATVNEQMKAFAQTTDWLTVIDGTEKLLVSNAISPVFFENGKLTAEGYGAYVATVCAATGLCVDNGSDTFGSAAYGESTIGWTTNEETFALTGRKGDGKKFAYFKDVQSASALTASASFTMKDIVNGGVLNGDETPSFGMVLATATARLYFYITETYSDGELMQKQAGYTLVENGEVLATETLDVIAFYTDGNSVTLKVDKSADGIRLYVGDMKLFELTNGTLCAASTEVSAGVYAENRAVSLTAAEISDKGV